MQIEKNKYIISTDKIIALFAAVTWGYTMWSRTAFNYYTSELKLSASNAGIVNFATSIGCTISAITLCRLADKKRLHKQVLAGALILASIMQFLISGADSLIAIIACRFIAGLGFGCVYSLTQAIVKGASTPESYSTNAGIVENGEAIISTMMGPTVIVFLISCLEWKRANIFQILPLLMIAVIWFVFSQKDRQMQKVNEVNRDEKISFRKILSVHNMKLCVLLGILTLTNIWTMYIYAPMYWTQSVGYSDGKMSRIMTCMGLVAIGWCMVLPALSNKIGRIKVAGIFSVLCGLTYFCMFLIPKSAATVVCFILFASSAFPLSMFFMAVIATESVKPQHAASAISIVNASSEIFGGAVGPLIAGLLAERYGVGSAMLYASICMLIVFVLTRLLHETAPGLERK